MRPPRWITNLADDLGWTQPKYDAADVSWPALTGTDDPDGWEFTPDGRIIPPFVPHVEPPQETHNDRCPGMPNYLRLVGDYGVAEALRQHAKNIPGWWEYRQAKDRAQAEQRQQQAVEKVAQARAEWMAVE